MDAIRAGYATEGQGVTPLAAALACGAMREQGIALTLDKLGDAHEVAAALASGDIAFGNLAAPGLVGAVASGAELAFLTGGVNQQFLVGSPGMSLEALAGQKVASSRPGDLTDFLLQITMERVLHAKCEIEFVGSSRQRIEALLDGRVAATPLAPPTAIEAKHAGCPWLFDYGDLGLNFAIGGIAASTKTIEGQPDLVERFLRGYLNGQRMYKADREFGIAVHERYGETSRRIAEETYDVTRDGFRDVPDPATEGMRMLIDFWLANGTLPESFRLERVVDPGPILALCADPGLP